MAKKTDVNFNYIPRKRYIVEIKNEDTGEIFYTQRFCWKDKSISFKDHYSSLMGLIARVLDTKTGEVI